MATRRRDRTVLRPDRCDAALLQRVSAEVAKLGVPLAPGLMIEQVLAEAGQRIVAGVDEVGRGALAGPLVAAAVVLPPVGNRRSAANLLTALAGVRDSKQLSASQRSQLFQRISSVADGIGLAVIPVAAVDALGIGPTNRLALWLALANLPQPPDHALLDAVILPELTCDQTALIHGDARSLSIAAASIIAKVTRDELLDRQGRAYPLYGFEDHKGYGTARHLAALRQHGPCSLHRRGFAPVRALLDGSQQPAEMVLSAALSGARQ